MPDPIATGPVTPLTNDGALTSTDVTAPSETPGNDAATSAEKAAAFEELLNSQQQITEQSIKYETQVFDAAQDVELQATFTQPAKAAQL